MTAKRLPHVSRPSTRPATRYQYVSPVYIALYYLAGGVGVALALTALCLVVLIGGGA